ncbi:MAG: class I SAM-dependent DNA methyltransferase [Alphaproteobacteria bacterium]
MPDPIFEHARLVEIYDAFDGPRHDLEHYLAIVKELKARSILDIGCGTGCFSCLLSQHGFDVVGVDPAQSSLAIARKKPHAEQVRWIVGDATSLSSLHADLAVMTGNVAQVFLTDEAWENSLIAIHQALRSGGHLVFEVRDPAQKAWLKWTREHTYQRIHIPTIGFVEGWCDVTNLSEKFVSFRWTYVFESDGEILFSDSTLRFRDREEITNSLERLGYTVKEVRDAPDRPQQEFVFIAATA